MSLLCCNRPIDDYHSVVANPLLVKLPNAGSRQPAAIRIYVTGLDFDGFRFRYRGKLIKIVRQGH